MQNYEEEYLPYEKKERSNSKYKMLYENYLLYFDKKNNKRKNINEK
jgi:hypothetical protein